MEIIKKILNLMLAGAGISLGAYMSLQYPGILGSILFSIGLMSVCTFRLSLYTGCIRKTKEPIDAIGLLIVLIGNIAGCILMSFWSSFNTDIIDNCKAIVEQRIEWGFIECMARGVGCGFIMTLAVSTWKQNPWPLLIGIPAFVLCGFTHSVADAFYYSVGWEKLTWAAASAYSGTVVGNFIGGIIYKAGKIQ